MVPAEGIEPPLDGLQNRCLAIRPGRRRIVLCRGTLPTRPVHRALRRSPDLRLAGASPSPPGLCPVAYLSGCGARNRTGKALVMSRAGLLAPRSIRTLADSSADCNGPTYPLKRRRAAPLRDRPNNRPRGTGSDQITSTLSRISSAARRRISVGWRASSAISASTRRVRS